jgi:glutamine synthetase
MSNRFRVLFLDQLNIARGKYIPETKDKSVRFCVGSYSAGYSGNPPAGGSSIINQYNDIEAKFDWRLARPSWEPGTQIVLADMCLDGEPFPLCGRTALKRAIDAWKAVGMNPMVGYETEANIFEQDHEGWKPYNKYKPRFYSTGAFSDPAGLIDDIWNMAETCNLPLESAHSEYDSGQFEFTMKYDDALQATDNVFLFRQMAREILIKRGYLLSYMPVPKTEGWNALHFNISFTDIETGENIFSGEEMSDVMKGCIAGLFHHHKSLAAIVAPTVNSYERVDEHRAAGYWANWAKGSRHSSLRVSTETGARARIEYRVADYSANPYFALAALLQAMLLGYKHKYPFPESETNKSLAEQKSTKHTPHSLSESLEYLKDDDVLSSAIGKTIIDHYISLKNKEVEEIEGKTVEEQFDYYSCFI